MDLAYPLEEYPLMFITDSIRSKGRPNLEVVRCALEGGCRWIQYRAPELPDDEFYNDCLKIMELCNEVGAGLLVNDRLDIAALVRAHGIHLGEGALPVGVVKEYMGEEFLVGYSAHTIEQAISAAWQGADFITYSPLFALKHKDSPYAAHGVNGAQEVMTKVNVPVFLLGGISLPDIKELKKAITDLKIAAVSMITEADDITTVTEEIVHQLGVEIGSEGDTGDIEGE